MNTPQTNRLQREMARLERMPGPLRGWLLNIAIRRAIPLTGTAKLEFLEIGPEHAVVHLPCRRRVANHLGGIHAAATALLAETASGLAFGWHLPADRLPVLKRLNIRYTRLAKGALTAKAALPPEIRTQLQTEPKGSVTVPVSLQDETGESPADCEIIWSWIPRGERKASA